MEHVFPFFFLISFVQDNLIYFLWGIQIVIGIYFVIKDKWILGFKIFPFGVSTTNFNSSIAFLGHALQQPLTKWMNITREPISWASVLFLPTAILAIVLMILVDAFRILLRSLFVLVQNVSLIDFDSVGFWMAVLLAFFLHELLHGIVATANGIKVKTVGALVIPNILYAAYVQIDYDEFIKKDQIDEQPQPVPLYEDPEKEYLRKRLLEMEKTKPVSSKENDPFDVEDENKRKILRNVLAAGITGNLFLLIFGIFSQLMLGSLQFAKYLVGSNLLLIGLNLFPMAFFDGGKLVPLTLKGRISDANLKTIRTLINYLTLILILLAF